MALAYCRDAFPNVRVVVASHFQVESETETLIAVFLESAKESAAG
jgi:hypothetical protein